MSNLDKLGLLTEAEYADLTERVDRFHATRKAYPATDLADYLPPATQGHRPFVLVELIKTELEVRAQAGESIRIEPYLSRFQAEIPDGEFPISLLMEEYRLRHKLGDKPSLEEYRQRFPEQFNELAAEVSRKPGSSLSNLAREGTRKSDREITPLPRGVQETRASNVPEPPTQGEREAPTKTPTSVPGASDVLPAEFQYRLTRRIGEGAFGEVYEALAPGGFRVALKKILRDMNHPASRGEIESLEAIKSMSHPFLLQTQAYWVFQDRLVIVMDLAEGSLTDRIEHHQREGRQGVPPEELIPFFEQAAEALDYLHSQNVSHRDVKPQNLLYLKGYAKVADFGLARGHRHTETIVASEVGTPLYMAPEVWQQKVSLHSDQYSLAASYVKARLGHAPFNGQTQYELMFQHIEQTPDLGDLPEEEKKVLLKALAKKPDERYPSCAAFVKALREVVLEPPFAEPELRTRWRPVALAAVAALVLGLTLGAVGWYTGPRKVEVSEASIHLWVPHGWLPGKPVAIMTDSDGKKYFKQLTRSIDCGDGVREQLVARLVPRARPTDPPTFYMLENKITNRVFQTAWGEVERDNSSDFNRLRQGNKSWAEELFPGAWKQGALPTTSDRPLGIGGAMAGAPVARITAPEAIVVATRLDGLLPTRQQYLKAAGALDQDGPGGPAGSKVANRETKEREIVCQELRERNLALCRDNGPRPVDEATTDISYVGIRQLVSNGFEWTADLGDGVRVKLDTRGTTERWVHRVGQGWEMDNVLSFQELRENQGTAPWNDTDAQFTFRIVLQPPK